MKSTVFAKRYLMGVQRSDLFRCRLYAVTVGIFWTSFYIRQPKILDLRSFRTITDKQQNFDSVSLLYQRTWVGDMDMSQANHYVNCSLDVSIIGAIVHTRDWPNSNIRRIEQVIHIVSLLGKPLIHKSPKGDCEDKAPIVHFSVLYFNEVMLLKHAFKNFWCSLAK